MPHDTPLVSPCHPPWQCDESVTIKYCRPLGRHGVACCVKDLLATYCTYTALVCAAWDRDESASKRGNVEQGAYHDNIWPCSASLWTCNPYIYLGMAMYLVSNCRRAARYRERTWNLFLELPGLLKSLFSPTFRDPSLMA